jgi:HAD superfamily phosphoserine phosphatase-like hydrolase
MSIRLVAFDLDGTLLRGRNALTVIAHALDHPEWEQQMEILNMRGESSDQMARRVAPWTRLPSRELSRHLALARVAPGVEEAFQLLHRRRIRTAIASIGWDFAVEWFAERFGAADWVATRLAADGTVTPLWPEDKGPWLEQLTCSLGLIHDEVAAVGDSPRDAWLLQAAGHAFYVGTDAPDGLGDVEHHPDADMADVARAILRR